MQRIGNCSASLPASCTRRTVEVRLQAQLWPVQPAPQSVPLHAPAFYAEFESNVECRKQIVWMLTSLIRERQKGKHKSASSHLHTQCQTTLESAVVDVEHSLWSFATYWQLLRFAASNSRAASCACIEVRLLAHWRPLQPVPQLPSVAVHEPAFHSEFRIGCSLWYTNRVDGDVIMNTRKTERQAESQSASSHR